MTKRLAIIGGGAAGTALLWCLAKAGRAHEATLFHDEDEIGGHSRTIPISFDESGVARVAKDLAADRWYPVDIGVQFVAPSIYPNLYKMLELDEFRGVTLSRHAELRMSGAFTEQLVWGNFPEYQAGERFKHCFDGKAWEDAKRFERDVQRAPFASIGGRRIITMSVDEYLTAAGYDRSSNFFRYQLIPYLCIINGYGTTDLLLTNMEDLFPLFTKLPGLQDAGPYASFVDVGRGWDRFENGSTQWARTMANAGESAGAKIRTCARVKQVRRRGAEWIVEWSDGATYGEGGEALPEGELLHGQAFDEVVFTTDMTTNRQLLGHDDNPLWSRHRVFLSADRFRLIPGACYIHQDETLLSPHLRDGLEDGQFVGSYAWGDRDEGSDLYDLPYDLGAAFQTYLMQRVLGTPAQLYVSMYAEARRAVVPAPEKTQFVRTWRHGRWVASFFRQAKKELHEVQGASGLWFAGNNTTIDSEEGALLSAMIIADKISNFRYPFSRLSSAWALYSYFHEMMFPSTGGLEVAARVLLNRRQPKRSSDTDTP